MGNKLRKLTNKILVVGITAALVLFALKRLSATTTSTKFSQHEDGVTHILVTGGAGYIG